MKSLIYTCVIVSLFITAPESHAFSLFKKCLVYNDSPDNGVYHEIINADILKIGNNKLYVFALVECRGVARAHAFSRFSDGSPLIPNSSVVIPGNREEICEGDTLSVYGKRCEIVSMTTEKR